MPVMTRMVLAVVMNLTVPGTGLILLGRAWLGFAVAVWFGLAVEVAVCGKLIAPATTAWTLTVASAILGACAWLLGQGLLAARVIQLRDRLPAGIFAAGESDR
jgi:hypothetical protein